MYLLGIDLGTSSVKTIIIDSEGRILDGVTEYYDLFIPKEGWTEQYPSHWWEATLKTLEKLGSSYDFQKLAGISFSGQMHGLVILDSNDEVIRPAILWNDSRTKKEVEYLNHTVRIKKLLKETGNIAYAGFTAPKILWVKENEPENFKKIRKILLPKDYLSFKLTGRYVTDFSDASGTLLMDVRKKKWSNYMINICDINYNQLPEIIDSFKPVGKITEDLANELNINKDCLVMAGAGDNAAAAVGVGLVNDGECNISLGTSGTLFVNSERFIDLPNSELHSFAHANGKYHVMGVVLSAGSANKWWIENILDDNIKKHLSTLSLSNSIDSDIYFLPYLMGERSPHNDESIRACFIGMSLNTSKEAMTLAVLEGVAFALRDCIEVLKEQGIKITSTKITGGGAKSQTWIEIISNVLNIKVEVMVNDGGPSLGAAVLAGVGAGIFNSIEDAWKKIGYEIQIVQPTAEMTKTYQKKYEKYKLIYPMIKDFFD